MITLAERPAAEISAGDRRRRLLGGSLTGVATLAGGFYLYTKNPYQPGHYPTCIFLAATGYYCPGCGLLRATHDLLHLDLAGAFARNPLVPPLAVLGLYLLARWTFARLRGRELSWTPAPWFGPVLGITMVLFTIARNIPGWDALSPA